MHSVTNHCDFNSKNPFLLLKLLQITTVCQTHVPRSSWNTRTLEVAIWNMDIGNWRQSVNPNDVAVDLSSVWTHWNLGFSEFVSSSMLCTVTAWRKLAVFVCLCKLDLMTWWVHVREGCCLLFVCNAWLILSWRWMVEDEVTCVQLQLKRMREEIKGGGAMGKWGRRNKWSSLEDWGFLKRVLLCWIVDVFFSYVALLTS